MKTIEILRGIPSCGKSRLAMYLFNVYAHPTGQKDTPKVCKRISRNNLREMLDFDVYTPQNELFIKDLRNKIIKECLDQDIVPIVDDTNLRDGDVEEIKALANYFTNYNCEVIVRDVVAPLDKCIEMNNKKTEDLRVPLERMKEFSIKHQEILNKGQSAKVVQNLFNNEF